MFDSDNRRLLARYEDEYRRTRELREQLAFFEDPQHDNELTEGSAEKIEELWQQIHIPGVIRGNPPRYFEVDLDERGVVVGSHQVDPLKEGYTFCPVRMTTQSIYAKEPTTEVEGSHFARTAMEAVAEAKRAGLNTLMSDHENLLKLEVLLSGDLKFEGQDSPRWFPVQYICDGEAEALDQAARQWMIENGYEPSE